MCSKHLGLQLNPTEVLIILGHTVSTGQSDHVKVHRLMKSQTLLGKVFSSLVLHFVE